MPTLKELENTNELNNPYNQRAASLANREQQTGEDAGVNAGINQLEQYANDPNNATKNIDAANQAEQTRQGLYTGTGGQAKTRKLTLKENIKKKGPLGGIIGFIIGVPTLIAIFLSPALVLQQFAETLTDSFNDQLAAMDMRSVTLLKKKYSSTFTSGACSTVTIRCKYQSVRENSGLAKRLNNAGIEIEGNRSLIPGRVKPTHFVFEGKRIPADQLLNEAKTNAGLRSALRKGYDPLYAAFSDRKSADIRSRLGLKRSSTVTPSSSTEEMDSSLKDTAAGTNDIDENTQKLTAVTEDRDGRQVTVGYQDAEGNRFSVEEGESFNSRIDELNARNELADSLGKTATRSLLKGTLTATAFGAGSVDSLCTVWNMIRVAGYAAKIYQQKQLIRYSYEFMKIAHKQKAGDLTADEANFFMSKLTAMPNSEGKTALDAAGYKWAAYGDTFNPGDFSNATGGIKEGEDSTEYIEKLMIQNETGRYVNGQLVSSSLMAQIAGLVTKKDSNTVAAADRTCDFTKSWKGQAIVFGLAALGVVAAIFSGGASVSIGAVAQGAASVAISVALSLLQPKLIDMAKGEVIQGDENSNEVGNAVVSGMGGYNAQTAQGRGLGVATQDTYSAYTKLSQQVAAKYAKEDRDSRSPFDPTSKNTFIGSVIYSIVPYLSKTTTVGSVGISTSSFVANTFLNINQPVGAAGNKYNSCDDPEYDELNLAADPFCNLRYSIPVEDLNIDPETVLDFMLTYRVIVDPETGEKTREYLYLNSPEDETPKGEYQDYIERCFDRVNSIGDGLSDPSEGTGEECIIGKGGSNENRNKMFRLFYIDTSVHEGMEEDFQSETPKNEGSTDLTEDLNLRVATFNAGGDPKPDETMINKMTETLKKNQPSIVGFQEFNDGWSNAALDESRTDANYAMYPASGSVNAIVYNSDFFEVVKGGIMPDLKYFNGAKLEAPYVLLRHIATGKEMYVLNTHDPAKPENADLRLQNARQHVKFIKSLDKNVPIIFTGDFNSGYSVRSEGNTTVGDNPENLTYCILTKDANMNDSFDLANNRPNKCPNPGNENTVDHIYLSEGITVEKYFRDYGGDVHDSHFADITIPGSGGPGSVEWPVDIKYWEANKYDFLKQHFAGSGTWTNGVNSLAADIGSPPDGSAVYAMLGGTVSRPDLGGHGLIISSKVSGGTVDIAYAHGPRYNQNTSYKTGDQILRIGNLGNSSGGHVHIDISFTPDGGAKRGVCPQDVFIALDKGERIDWASLSQKAVAPCAGRV